MANVAITGALIAILFLAISTIASAEDRKREREKDIQYYLEDRDKLLSRIVALEKKLSQLESNKDQA